MGQDIASVSSDSCRGMGVFGTRTTMHGIEMTSDTCQLIATVMPLIMVTLVVERRSMRLKLRRRVWFRKTILGVFEASIVGLFFVIIGTQLGGLSGAAGVLAWVLTVVSVGGLGLLILISMASVEADEDEDAYPDVAHG